MAQRIILFFFVLLNFSIFAQRYTFQSYNTAQGLPQSQVTSIQQDERGYLWVGTLGGLARFNGKEFETYTTEQGLLNNRITFLTFIKGVLWIGHEGGISKYDGKKFSRWAFEQIDRKSNVTDIIVYRGELLISSNGGGVYRMKGDKLSPVGLSDEFLRVRDMEVWNGSLLLGTRSGLVTTNDLKRFSLDSSTLDLSISSVAMNHGELFFTTYQDGLYKYSKDKLTRLGDPDSLSTLRFCFFDKNDNLWINTMQGIWRSKNMKVDLKLNEQNGLPMEAIQTIFQDRSGNIWLGSEGKGLLRFTGEKFVYYDQRSGLNSDLISSVNQDKNGVFWLGTYDKGLMSMDRKGRINSFDLDNSTVWTSLLNIDGKDWFGTSNGLYSMKNGKVEKVYFYEDGLPGDKITALIRLNGSSFYVGGSEGVSLFRNGRFEYFENQDIETVRSFCNINGDFYCATDKGLFLIKGRRTIKVGEFNSSVYSLAKDRLNRLWVGTEEGLFRQEGSKFIAISISRNAAANIVNFINYKDDQLFVGTNNGLYVLEELQNETPKILRYGIAEGMVDLETNANSSFFDSKGRFWFGTASGLVCFRPEYLQTTTTVPNLILKRILLNYQLTDLSDYTDKIDKYGTPENLVLPYSKNNVSFELDGIALSNYTGMRFQYMLEGLEMAWSPLSANTSISYTALPSGDYVFLAKCIDAKGVESGLVRIPFSVRPPFYLTWWFISLMIIVGVALVFWVFRIRLKREREANEKERLEFKSRLLTLEQRSLNASMNRHFIFNSLNSIQYFINTQDRLSANRFLTNFAKLIRKNLDSSEEGNMVTLEQELERLDLYLSLESMRFKDRFDYTIRCDEAIEKENVVIPAMILQPFVENSIIHGILPNEEIKGKIDVVIEQSKEQLIIEITDNGIGIDNSRKSKSEFEGDHRSQGMEITHKRIEILNRLSDRKFEIIGPVQIEDEYRSVKGTRVTLKMSLNYLEE
jgi:ligand-binding sensor domain-containing protein/two-component sensor histidine kinase